MSIPEKYNYRKIASIFEEAKTERADYYADWLNISKFIVPGRGIFNETPQRKRKLTNNKIINNIAESSLEVLTAGLHAGLTSPSIPWFNLEWVDAELNKNDQLEYWLQQAVKICHDHLHRSNFYSIINPAYKELSAFGTCCIYVGADSTNDDTPLRFEVLTVGEYAFLLDSAGKVVTFFRVLFKSIKQIVDEFGDGAPKEYREAVKQNKDGINIIDRTILEFVTKEEWMGKQYIRLFYDINKPDKPLRLDGFYEMPYKIARWSTIGSDIYGVGPGNKAVNDVKRLQEMEKAFLMATHKAINPPLNVPARMRGKVNTLPGGLNYKSNQNDSIDPLYRVQFEYQGVTAAIERVEQRIQKIFFNDIFLSIDRAGGKSPLKAAEVNVREQEKMLRLGPVIESLQNEFLSPIIERIFNILIRAHVMPVLDPELAAMVGDYNITLISPLATAQRAVALQGINSFLVFVGQAAQYDQQALDKINIDSTIDTYAHITGTPKEILNTDEQVAAIRKQRAQAMAAEKNKQEQAIAAQGASQLNAEQARARKDASEAAINQAELDKQMLDVGII